MGTEGNLPYAATRVQARHGERLSELTWRSIEAARNLAQYLEGVRGSALGPWVAGIEPTHDAHAIERTLRSEWRRYVRTVAGWHPREWQAWLNWWSWLPLLPLIARLSYPEPAPAWMLADEVCGSLAPGSPPERAAAVEATPLAPFAPVVRGQGSVRSVWLEEAARRAPFADRETAEHLRRLMRQVPASVPGAAAPLLRLFRNAAGTAVASGCHLALLSLDLERLRGGLIVRSLFRHAGAQAA
jgi:hypothetical protein